MLGGPTTAIEHVGFFFCRRESGASVSEDAAIQQGETQLGTDLYVQSIARHSPTLTQGRRR